MKMEQSRQKNYADRRCRPLEIDVEDYIFLKVCPAKGIIRFAMVGKLSTRYIGPYCITQRVGGVAYRLELAPEPRIHNVFHVS